MTRAANGGDSEGDAGNAGDPEADRSGSDPETDRSGSDPETDRSGSDTDAERSGSDPGADVADDPAADVPDGPECPFCGSTATERESRFGSEISKEQHYCTDCRTVFERIKYDGERADTRRPE